MCDPKAQLEAVAQPSFETVPLLNASGARLLPLLDAVVADP